MGQKKMQGADGVNFQLQLTVAGLESINLPEENLVNKSGNDIMKISCWGGKLSAYVNLPNAVRPNNVQPFQLSDCIKIDLVRNQVIDNMRSYLQRNLKDKYSDEFLSMMSVTKMECNLTVKCVGNCKPKDVIRLFEKSFPKVTVYKETAPNGKTHKKPERGITTTKPHEWVLKVYDKTFQQRQAGNLKVESNLIRVELVYLDRILNHMYGDKKSLEDILTRKSIKTLIVQYQVTFDEICQKNIKPMLDACAQDIFETLTQSDDIDFSNKEISIAKSVGKTESGFDYKEPKTQTSIRTVPFPEEVIALLKQYHIEYIQERFKHGTAWQGDLEHGGNIFIQSDGKRMGHTTPYQYFVKHLHRYNEWVKSNPVKAKAEGLEELPIIPLHGLRHSCATLLNYLEVNIIDISKILGHSTPSTTMNIYAHSFEEQKRVASNKIDEFLRKNA